MPPPFPNWIIIAESRPRLGAAFRSADRSLRRSLLRPRLRPRSLCWQLGWEGGSPWGHGAPWNPWLFLVNWGIDFFGYIVPIYGKKMNICTTYKTCCLNWRVSVSIQSNLIVPHSWSISQEHDCEISKSEPGGLAPKVWSKEDVEDLQAPRKQKYESWWFTYPNSGYIGFSLT